MGWTLYVATCTCAMKLTCFLFKTFTSTLWFLNLRRCNCLTTQMQLPHDADNGLKYKGGNLVAKQGVKFEWLSIELTAYRKFQVGCPQKTQYWNVNWPIALGKPDSFAECDWSIWNSMLRFWTTNLEFTVRRVRCQERHFQTGNGRALKLNSRKLIGDSTGTETVRGRKY